MQGRGASRHRVPPPLPAVGLCRDWSRWMPANSKHKVVKKIFISRSCCSFAGAPGSLFPCSAQARIRMLKLHEQALLPCKHRTPIRQTWHQSTCVMFARFEVLSPCGIRSPIVKPR